MKTAPPSHSHPLSSNSAYASAREFGYYELLKALGLHICTIDEAEQISLAANQFKQWVIGV